MVHTYYSSDTGREQRKNIQITQKHKLKGTEQIPHPHTPSHQTEASCLYNYNMYVP
jgi:hypothetical protein